MATHPSGKAGDSGDGIKGFDFEAYSGWAPNDTLVDAMNSEQAAATAAGRVLAVPRIASVKFGGGALPIDDPRGAELTQCNARRDAALNELLGGLFFDPGRDERHAADGDAMTLHVLTATSSADPPAVNTVAAPLAMLRRPPLAVLTAQLGAVLAAKPLRDFERGREILAQVGPLNIFWAARLGLSEGRTPYTLDLMYLLQRLAALVAFRFKYAFSVPRPYEISPQPLPMLGTPGHGTFPAGHATEAFCCAEVLRALTGQAAGSDYDDEFQKLALRICDNRVVSGVHFPIDNIAGRVLGTTLGEYVVTRSAGGGGWLPRGVDGSLFNASSTLDVNLSLTAMPARGLSAAVFGLGNRATTAVSPVLPALWAKARAEMVNLGF